MVENAPSFLLASVESYLGSKVANRENADALVRQLSLLFSITSDNAGPDDLQRFDDVFVSLADRVDADARGFLALQLSVSVNAPHRILRRLAGDVITVARPILIHSPLLTDADLVEIAKRHGIAHMQAIAERNELTIEVTDILILDGDDAVRRSVAANHGAEISTSGLRRLSEQAVGDEELEVAMTQRPDVPEIIIRFLVRHGSGAAQRILNDRSTAIATPVDERLHVPSRSIDAWYAVYDFDAAEARVAVLTEQGMRGEQLLMRFVAEERFPEAVLVLARLIGVRIGTMVAWMTTEKPDHFLAAARAIELSARAVFAILNIGPWRLLLDGRRRQDAVRSYQALDVEDARRRVHDWRYAPVRLTPAPM